MKSRITGLCRVAVFILAANLLLITTDLPATAQSAPDDEEETVTAPPDLGSLMTKRHLGCEDVSYNVFDLLPQYFYADEPDSVLALIAYWKDMCGPAEPVLRAEILTGIWLDSFSEEFYDEDIIEHLLWFQLKLSNVTGDWTSHLWKSPYYDASPAENLATLEEYDEFMADLADQLFPFTAPGSLERLYCHFYRGETDTLFHEIKKESYRDTKVRQAYDADVARLKKVADLDIALTMGYWHPRGGLSSLGSHPTVGALAGMSGKSWVGRIAAEVRLGNPPDYYRIMLDDEIIFTDHYFGFYLGVEGGLRLFRTRHHALDILGGVGYDGIETLASSEFEDSDWLNSVNLNSTVGYRFYVGNQSQTQIGVEARYEKTFHDSGGGDDLSGDAWNIRLVVGWSGDKWRNRRLNALRTDRWGR